MSHKQMFKVLNVFLHNNVFDSLKISYVLLSKWNAGLISLALRNPSLFGKVVSLNINS